MGQLAKIWPPLQRALVSGFGLATGMAPTQDRDAWVGSAVLHLWGTLKKCLFIDLALAGTGSSTPSRPWHF